MPLTPEEIIEITQIISKGIAQAMGTDQEQQNNIEAVKPVEEPVTPKHKNVSGPPQEVVDWNIKISIKGSKIDSVTVEPEGVLSIGTLFEALAKAKEYVLRKKY